jgi:hypothetical protein
MLRRQALLPTSVVEAVSSTFPLLSAAAVDALGRATLEILALEFVGATLRLPTGAEAAADKGILARGATDIVVVAAAEAAKSRPAASVRAAAADVVLGLVR